MKSTISPGDALVFCFALHLDLQSYAVSLISHAIEMNNDRFPCLPENIHAEMKVDGWVEEELENNRVGTQKPHRRAFSVKSAAVPELSIIVLGHRPWSFLDSMRSKRQG